MNIVDVRMGRRSIGVYEHISDGRQKWPAKTHVPRHRHTEAFASLVLSGGFQECGNRGRFNVGPGDVLMHGAFDSHLDRIFVVGAEVLNLTLPGLGAVAHSLGRVSDPDTIVKAAESDPVTAAGILCEQLVPAPNMLQEWPDLLAADLLEDPNRRLDDWAEEHQLALETLSRGFSRAFGMTPVVFRSEARARKAFEQIVQGTEVLSKVLEASGFADQAHMSRAIRSLTGATPKSWLRRASFKSPLSA
jgi:AraC-like DNA-binding protein